MSSILKVFLGFVLLVLLSTSVSAVSCNFDAVINSAQVRSDSDLVWSSSVDAEFDDFIDIQTNVRLNKMENLLKQKQIFLVIGMETGSLFNQLKLLLNLFFFQEMKHYLFGLMFLE
jgi:hypothetical protein